VNGYVFITRDKVASEVLGPQHGKMTEQRNADIIGGDYSVRTPADKRDVKLKKNKYALIAAQSPKVQSALRCSSKC
jgi:hypothetical protein